MLEANKFKLGLFVIVALVLLISSLFVFGLSEMFKTSMPVYTVFKTSIQGLSVGSAVKYRGVPVGKVSRILVRGEEELIIVQMELDVSVFKTENDRQMDMKSLNRMLQEQMKRGLTCGLEYVGITGMKYVELDYVNDEKNFTPLPQPDGVAGCYIPSRQSMFQNIVKMINQSLSNIASINIPEISRELSSILKHTNNILSDPKITRTIAHLEQVAQKLDQSLGNVNKTLTPKKLDEMFNLLSSDLRNFNELIVQVKQEIEAAKISKTSEAFRNSLNSVSETKMAIINTLLRMDQTLDSITELVNTVDDDPSVLLRGKQNPPLTGRGDRIKTKFLPSSAAAPASGGAQ
ncbi:MAG: MlaD family protein [Victivallales bacterium]|nr:MlaD family protein [Victivallales bacterium]